ncbi:MAG: hypothetical protein GWP91_01960 [Rhodobacterales bacterium]|nr:hypothetical protein [Rhodobacterales bacterium]
MLDQPLEFVAQFLPFGSLLLENGLTTLDDGRDYGRKTGDGVEIGKAGPGKGLQLGLALRVVLVQHLGSG